MLGASRIGRSSRSRPGHHCTVTGLWLYTLRELLDKLDELAGEHGSQRPLRLTPSRPHRDTRRHLTPDLGQDSGVSDGAAR